MDDNNLTQQVDKLLTQIDDNVRHIQERYDTLLTFYARGVLIRDYNGNGAKDYMRACNRMAEVFNNLKEQMLDNMAAWEATEQRLQVVKHLVENSEYYSEIERQVIDHFRCMEDNARKSDETVH